jgi:hypothetical protein
MLLARRLLSRPTDVIDSRKKGYVARRMEGGVNPAPTKAGKSGKGKC